MPSSGEARLKPITETGTPVRGRESDTGRVSHASVVLAFAGLPATQSGRQDMTPTERVGIQCIG